MYANDQELSAFKALLINENLEESKRIFTSKLDVFRNQIKTASDLVLQNLPRDDFATCFIPADVNQVKGERFSALKATANGDCLFNSTTQKLLSKNISNVFPASGGCSAHVHPLVKRWKF